MYSIHKCAGFLDVVFHLRNENGPFRIVSLSLSGVVQVSLCFIGFHFDVHPVPFLIASVVVPCPAAHLGPAPLSVRLLSCRIRPGMEWAQPNLISSVFQSSRRPSRASETDLNSQRSGAGSRKFSCSSFDMRWEVSNPGSMSYSTPPATPSLFAPQAVQESSLDDLSPYLLFHIHGGGFVALNSQAQDVSFYIYTDQAIQSLQFLC